MQREGWLLENRKKRKSRDELIRAVKGCKSISQLFELVREENIPLQMQSLNSASSVSPKAPNIPTEDSDDTHLSRLKDAVLACVINNR